MRERCCISRNATHGTAGMVQVQLRVGAALRFPAPDHLVDGLVRELLEHRRGEVVVRAGLPQRVERLLHRHIWHRAHVVEDRNRQ